MKLAQQPSAKPQLKRPPLAPAPPVDAAPQPPKQGRPRIYAVLLAVGAVTLGVATVLAASKRLSGWEHSVFTAINGAHLPGWVGSQIARPLSNAVWGIVGLVVLLLLIPKYRLMAWQYAAAAGSTYVAAAIIEHIIDRGRPLQLTHDLVLRASQGGPGFPSGHVAVLTALCATLWLFVSWPWRALLVLFVLAEAWSRIYLGVHAPLDVIGGVGVALMVIAALHLLPVRLREIFRLHQ